MPGESLSSKSLARLGLGTVQFGMDYGISNPDGQTPEDEVRRILTTAGEAGVAVIDTAAAYGESEAILGKTLPLNHAFRIVTKTEAIKKDRMTASEAARISDGLSRSLDRLRCKSIHGLMLHHADDILAPGGELLWQVLMDLKNGGRVNRIGVSTYAPDQVDKILDSYPIDLIQVPLNVLDQRLLSGGQLARLSERGVEVHVRSVFLQGLLLMAPGKIPDYFRNYMDRLSTYHDRLRERGLTPVQAALSFVLGLDKVDYVIVGVCSRRELTEILEAASSPGDLELSDMACDDEAIVNPSRWLV